MHTTIAFAEAHTPDTTWLKLNAVPDQHIRISGEKIYISDYNHLIGSAAHCTGLAEARLVSPSLRRVNPFYIAPCETALVPTEPVASVYHPQSPVRLDTNEALEVEFNGAAAGPFEATCVVFLAPGAIPPVNGEIFTINASMNKALVVQNWVYSEITFPDSMPVGNYRVVGARVVRTNGVAFRFVPVGEPFRPGGLVAADVGALDPDLQRFGGLGSWFTFNSIQPPGIELLGSAAGGTTSEIYIDLIKI